MAYTFQITFSGSLPEYFNQRQICTSGERSIIMISDGGTSGNRFFCGHATTTTVLISMRELNTVNNFVGVQDCRIVADNKGIVYVFVPVSGKIRVYNSTNAFSTYVEYSDPGAESIGKLDVDVDSNNTIHIGFELFSTVNNIDYNTYTLSSGFGTATDITTGVTYDQIDPVIAVDSTDNPFITWRGKTAAANQYNIRVADSDGSWAISEITTETNAVYAVSRPAIAADTDGNARIVWYQKNAAYPDAFNIRETAYDGSWNAVHNITAETTAGRDQINPFIGVQKYAATDDQFEVVWEGKTSGYASNYNIRNAAGYDAFDCGAITEITTAALDHSIFGVPRQWSCNTELAAFVVYDNATNLYGRVPQATYFNSPYALISTSVLIINPLDTKNPTVVSAISSLTEIEGGLSNFDVEAEFLDTNPGVNSFEYYVNAEPWIVSSIGSDGDLTPSGTIELSTPLDGNDLLYYRIVHTDDYGGQISSEDNTYVKPRPPAGPTLVQNGVNPDTAIDVTPVDNEIDAAAILSDVFEHKIHISPNNGTLVWVQSDGSLSATPEWNDVSTWGTVTVTGLTANTVYTFYSVSRNPSDNTTESNDGVSSQISTSSIVPVVDNVIVNKGSWENITITGVTQIDDIIEFNGDHYVSSYTTAGGVWKSSDLVTWVKIKTGKHRQLAEFDGYLYAYYHDGSDPLLIRTADGITWVTIATVAAPYDEINALLGSDTVGYIFYTTVDNAYSDNFKTYLSSDGTTFSEAVFDTTFFNNNSYAFNLKEIDSEIYLLINDQSSIGQAWTDLGQQVAETRIYSLIDLGSGIVLAGTYPNGKIFRSTDYGLTWIDLGQQGAEGYILSFANAGSGIVVAGTYPNGKIFRSIDYGATWADLGQQGVQTEIASLCFLGSSTIVAGTYPSGRMYRSTDNGANWISLGSITAQSHIYSIVNLGSGVAIAGCGDASSVIAKSIDTGATWSPITSLGFEAIVYSLTSLGSGVVLAGTYPNGEIFKSVNSGANWSEIGQLGSETAVYSLTSLGSGVVLAGTGPNGKIYRSVDSGDTWSEVGQLSSQVSILSLSYLDNGWVLAGTGNTGKILYSSYKLIFKWNDSVSRFEIQTKSISSTYTANDIVKFSVNDKYYCTVYDDNRVYESTDLLTWTLRKSFASEVPALNVSYRIFEYYNALYVSCYHSTNLVSQIWKSTDGVTWVLYMDFTDDSVVVINKFIEYARSLYIITDDANALYKNEIDSFIYNVLYRIEDDDDTTNTIKAEYDDGASNYLGMSSVTGNIGDITITADKTIKSIQWNAGNDYPDQDVTSDIKITTTDPSGGTDNSASSDFTLDTIKPTFCSETVSVSGITNITATLTWTGAVTETNFDHYEIIYSDTSLTNVINKIGSVWNDSDDATLGTKTTLTTIITGLTQNTLYHFALFGVDTSGNYSTPLSVSSTTLKSQFIDGWTMDEYDSIIGSVTIYLYDKSDGSLLASTTSDSSGYFSISFGSNATYFQLVGIKNGMQSVVLDNLTGTYLGDSPTESYNLNLKKQQFVYATGNLEIWIGDSNPTLFISVPFTKSSISVDIIKSSISVDITRSEISISIRRKSINIPIQLSHQ